MKKVPCEDASDVRNPEGVYRQVRPWLKALLVEARCNPERMAGIPVSGDMKAADDKSMTAILSEGYDTIPRDFPGEDADPIILAMARIALRRGKPIGDAEKPLIEALAADGIKVAELMGEAIPEMATPAAAAAGAANMAEAARLMNKAISRLVERDLDGAVTVSAAAAESAMQSAHERLKLDFPSKRTLPNLLVSLRRQTNIETLLGTTAEAERAVSALSALAENLYLVAQTEGDRHGGTAPPAMSPVGAVLFVGSFETNVET